MRGLLLLSVLVGCERTVSSDADCQAWVDTCAGCVQQCTAVWDVVETECDLGCPDEPLPACVAEAGSCVFSD